MSQTFRLMHVRRAGILLASGLACAAIPAVANASAVSLGTASPYVVLAGSAATNTGPSVLNGELGVAPGTSLSGFGSPAVVNGATHDDDAVATQAQNDLTTAYNTAAAQPVSGANNLTGQDLGGMTLIPGAYGFSSSAQLTGTLTLNAQGDPNAQFVFEIGSKLTTASASSVVLTNGASPCNVYWQVGSSATLGSTTAFQGNLMALTSIAAVTGSSVQGRLLARNGAVTLDDNSLDNAGCVTGAATPPGGTPSPTPTPTPISSTGPSKKINTRRDSAKLTRTKSKTTRDTNRTALAACDAGFTATVRGLEIKRVGFRLDGRWLGARFGSPARMHIPPVFGGRGQVTAHVTFKNTRRARTLTLRYAPCAAAVVHPLPAPSTFTG